MNEIKFNTSIRKFLKEVGVTAQREIERAVREALHEGGLQGNESLDAIMTLALEVGARRLTHVVEGKIDLG